MDCNDASVHGSLEQRVLDQTYYSPVRALDVEIEDSLKAEQAVDEASEMHFPAEAAA